MTMAHDLPVFLPYAMNGSRVQFVWVLLNVCVQPQAFLFVASGLQLGRCPEEKGGHRGLLGTPAHAGLPVPPAWSIESWAWYQELLGSHAA